MSRYKICIYVGNMQFWGRDLEGGSIEFRATGDGPIHTWGSANEAGDWITKRARERNELQSTYKMYSCTGVENDEASTVALKAQRHFETGDVAGPAKPQAPLVHGSVLAALDSAQQELSQLRDQCGTQGHNLREAYRIIGEQTAKIDAQAATIRRLEGKR